MIDEENAQAIAAMRMAVETLKARPLEMDDVHALDAVGVDIEKLVRPRNCNATEGTCK